MAPITSARLARLNLNAERLHPRAAELLPKLCKAVGADLPWNNNYLGLLARGVETVHALAVAANVLEHYSPAGAPSDSDHAPGGRRRARHRGPPRSLLASISHLGRRHDHLRPHRAPDQPEPGHDRGRLALLAPQLAGLSDEDATLRCEHLVRNFDPCISCSTHFLRLDRTKV